MATEAAVTKLREFLKTMCALLLLAILAMILVWLVWIHDVVMSRAEVIDQTFVHLSVAAANLDQATGEVNIWTHPILKKSYETMGETARTMKHIAHTTQEIENEQRQISEQTITSIETLNGAVENISRQTVATLKTTDDAMMQTKDVLFDLDQKVKDPMIENTFDNLNRITASWALMSGDSQKKLHSFLYPEPYQGKFRTLHKVWSISKGVVQFSEPAFYLRGLIQ
jgi:methyl-accepting chemotaxis protein